jgi:hypothetical protein
LAREALMVDATITEPRKAAGVTGRINFIVPGGDVYRRFVAKGEEANIGEYEAHAVHIRNGRSFCHRLTLDGAGFRLLDHKSAVADFFDSDEVRRVYPSEVCEAVQAVTGADLVLPMGWMVRTSGDEELLKSSVGYKKGGGGIQPPGAEVHDDVHFTQGESRARRVYSEHCPDGPGYSRFIISSFWRTFSEPPQDWPLALCDGTSVPDEAGIANTMVIVDELPDEATMRAPIKDEHLLPAASVFPYDPAMRWWYFPDMTRDEALLFKFYDSDQSGAWRVPHTAFKDESRVKASTRRSIEFRTVAYFY